MSYDAFQPLAGESAAPAAELVEAEIVKPRPWGFWATIGWSALGASLWVVVGVAVMLAFLPFRIGGASSAEIERVLEGMQTDGAVLAASSSLTAVAVALLVCGLSRLRGWTAREYLALSWPGGRKATLALGASLSMVVALDATSFALGRDLVPPFMLAVLESSPWTLVFLALVVAAPVGEELLFRGFMYRGLAASIGPAAAIGVTSLAFAVMHIQYDAYGMANVFVMGLLLGGVRQATGSTSLAIAIHGLLNAIATCEAILWMH